MFNVITITLTRPSTEIDWDQYQNSIQDYIKTAYVDTGRILSRQHNVSDDRLTCQIVTTFSDDTSALSFLQDPTIGSMVEQRNSMIIEAGGLVNFETN